MFTNTKLRLILLCIATVSGAISYFLIKIMENNKNSAGDDPSAQWDAGDLNGLLLFILIPSILVTMVSATLVFMPFKQTKSEEVPKNTS